MSPAEQRMAWALNGCRFVPGTGTKRFARDMAILADRHPEAQLTPKQREYLRTAVIRFAKQIDASVVALAFTPAAMRSYGAMSPLLKQALDQATPEDQ
jgi:hypothetical protein